MEIHREHLLVWPLHKAQLIGAVGALAPATNLVMCWFPGLLHLKLTGSPTSVGGDMGRVLPSRHSWHF